ncbi:ERI1 exoribonuclease 3 [Trichonephila clavata]|uniref:ERI1 exoribonuclease 3 n=1 Tax=Trichonephila clavata TaxID=2740835 RepID=A0A8X6LC99_TRICU|nr:ERI1 exoribonuclease 3 [Trichonephila clavata]
MTSLSALFKPNLSYSICRTIFSRNKFSSAYFKPKYVKKKIPKHHKIPLFEKEEIILAPKVPVKPKQLFDYFLVLDIEATCDSPNNVEPPEIIEFPVLKINAQTFETESIFHSYVRPVINPELTNFCIELTGIIQGMVNDEPEFKEVYQNFLQWLEKEHILKPGVKFAFVTCSDPDLNYFFPLQCRVSGIEVPACMKEWICVKRSFTDIHPYTWPDNISKMLEYCELKSEGDLHSGIDDAKNIARIIKDLAERGVVFKINGFKETHF